MLFWKYCSCNNLISTCYKSLTLRNCDIWRHPSKALRSGLRESLHYALGSTHRHFHKMKLRLFLMHGKVSLLQECVNFVFSLLIYILLLNPVWDLLFGYSVTHCHVLLLDCYKEHADNSSSQNKMYRLDNEFIAVQIIKMYSSNK